MKIPGIIGGLGPETTARIYLALAMQESAKDYPWNSYF
jgi:aspartate/glutamate racemase